MRTHLIAVGHIKAGPERELYAHHCARLKGAPDLYPNLREVEEKRTLPAATRKTREGELLIGALPAGAHVVALDETGKTLTSPAFAKALGGWRDDGVRDVAFVIGGADGLDPAVTGRAQLVLSLGAMTWPHMLVRGLLAEQLYRANAILTGHPYHRV